MNYIKFTFFTAHRYKTIKNRGAGKVPVPLNEKRTGPMQPLLKGCRPPSEA